MSEESVIEGLAERAVRAAMYPGPKVPMLCAVIRAAGRLLAEVKGHDFTSIIFSQEARRYAERAAAAGIRRSSR